MECFECGGVFIFFGLYHLFVGNTQNFLNVSNSAFFTRFKIKSCLLFIKFSMDTCLSSEIFNFQPFLSALLGKTKIKKLLSCVFFFNVRK